MFWSALAQWSAEPVPLLAAAAGITLYVAGRRDMRRCGDRNAWDQRDLWFTCGMAALLLSLISPIAAFDGRLQWDHMLQHVLMLALAPPLLIIGDAFPTVRRGVVAFRDGATPAWLARLDAAAVWFLRSRLAACLAFLMFTLNLLAWHIPAVYNLTLSSEPVHDLEHTLFFATGLLFWAAVIGSPSTRFATLQRRAVVAFAGLLVGWALAVVIGYASHPLYAYPPQPGISPLMDQQMAAGIMWVPASIPFVVALINIGIEWFEREEPEVALDGVAR